MNKILTGLARLLGRFSDWANDKVYEHCEESEEMDGLEDSTPAHIPLHITIDDLDESITPNEIVSQEIEREYCIEKYASIVSDEDVVGTMTVSIKKNSDIKISTDVFEGRHENMDSLFSFIASQEGMSKIMRIHSDYVGREIKLPIDLSDSMSNISMSPTAAFRNLSMGGGTR